MKKFCPNCGHPLKPNAAFCPNCGFELKGKSLTQPSQPVNSDLTRGSIRKKSRAHSKKGKVLLSIIGILIIALLGLYFWGSNYHNNAQPKKVNHTSRMVGKSSHSAPVGNLSNTDQTPKRVVSVVVTYAGKKYPEEWGSALDNGKNNEWQIDLKKKSNYPYMHQGSVAYMVTNDLGYTLTPVGDSDMQIYLFANKEQIGSASYGQMVYYLNHHNGEKTVKLLQRHVEILDEENSSENTQTTNKTDKSSQAKKTRLAGDDGLFNMPTNMQGTWYSYDYDQGKSILNIGAHQILWKNKSDSGTTILHKEASNFKSDNVSASYRKATQNWSQTSIFKDHWINTRSWLPSADDGSFYGLHIERGQQVLVVESGAGPWTDAVYWKTSALARQYKDIKFKDLHWR